MSSHSLLPSATILSGLFLLGACSSSSTGPSAQTLALNATFQSSETGTFDPTVGRIRVVLTGTGQDSTLGAFRVATNATVDPTTGAGTGTTTLTAADGATITATLAGQGIRTAGQPTVVIEQGTITGGTGRFANATGSYTLTRQTNEATGASTGTLRGAVRTGA